MSGTLHGTGPGPGHATRPSSNRNAEVTPLSVAIVLLRGRRIITASALLLAIPIGVHGLLKDRTWTAGSSFVAQSRRPQAALSGLAAQFGISVPTAEGGQSPDFFVDLLTSRRIIEAAMDSQYVVATGDDTVRGTLIELYDAEGETPALRREDAIDRVRDAIGASHDDKTGIIHLSVRSPYPALSRQLNERLFALLGEYNLVGRQSQARAEREFAERRLEEVRRDLSLAEERLQAFRRSNRVFSDASELALRQQRLERDVSRQQQLYDLLLQMFEQARLEEVRDTPVFTLIERPQIPLKPDPRGVVKRTFIALIAGLGLGIFVAFLREAVRRYRKEDVDGSDTLARLWNETRTDARRLATLGIGSGSRPEQRNAGPS